MSAADQGLVQVSKVLRALERSGLIVLATQEKAMPHADSGWSTMQISCGFDAILISDLKTTNFAGFCLRRFDLLAINGLFRNRGWKLLVRRRVGASIPLLTDFMADSVDFSNPQP